MSTVVVHIDAPYLTAKEYGRRTGQTESAIKQQMDKGVLPVFHQIQAGKERGSRFVNNALLIKQAMETE